MASDIGIAATFTKFGVRFSAGGLPDPSVKSKEDFFIYSARHIFLDGRTAKAAISWSFVHFGSLDQDKLLDLVAKENDETRAVIAAILVMLGKSGGSLNKLIEVKPLQSRLTPFGEFGLFGNAAFEKYNISAPGLKPEPEKYIRLRNP